MTKVIRFSIPKFFHRPIVKEAIYNQMVKVSFHSHFSSFFQSNGIKRVRKMNCNSV